MSGKWLHLGCGKRELHGYIHIDLSDYAHIDYRHDIHSLPMIDDNSCGGIYASHVFEYFDRVEAVAVLAEWCRVLRPGGILRLAVPDFTALASTYLSTGDISLVLGPVFGRWQATESLVIYHRTVYDKLSLSSLLEDNGFEGPCLWDWRDVFTGELEGFDDYSQAYYPHMDKENGRLMSLNLQAKKRA